MKPALGSQKHIVEERFNYRTSGISSFLVICVYTVYSRVSGLVLLAFGLGDSLSELACAL